MKLKRKIEDEIIHWYRTETKALLVKGARQVGKTHTIRSVLQSLGVNFIEFNLIENPDAIHAFEKYTDIDSLIMMLSTLTEQPIIKGETVIFIDEVQRYKEMVTKIKFLVDDGSFRFVLSGSLLGVEITNLNSAPVGYLRTLDMYPLDFEEFLQITNITDSVMEHLRTCFKNREPVNDLINSKMRSVFEQYLVIGGMPEAVARFAETRNINHVMAIHRDITVQYKMDFTQYESADKRLLLTNIYDLVPSELLKQNKRFIVTDLRKGLHFDRVQSSFLWLQNAGVVYTVYNATEPRIPLKLNEKQSLFKLYMSDVGLLTSIYGINTKRMILNQDSSLNAGGIYENAICSQLICNGYRPYFYNSSRIGELDFVIEYHGRICPIEVKSGKDYTIHSALNNAAANPEYHVEEAFVFANCNVYKDGRITYLPAYMSMFLNEDSDDGDILDIIQF